MLSTLFDSSACLHHHSEQHLLHLVLDIYRMFEKWKGTEVRLQSVVPLGSKTRQHVL